MESLFLPYLVEWEPFAYLVIFLGMFIEGDMVLFISVFLAHQGFLHLFPALLAALWGMILGDNLWYSLGRKLRGSDSILNHWAEKLAQPFDEHLKSNTLRTVFLSKFTYGIRSAIFFRAGILKIKWEKIEENDILATLFWMLIVGSLGYFSGASFSLIKKYFRYGEIGLLIFIIAFLFLQRFISKKSKKKL